MNDVAIEVRGLKCDAEGCNYSDMSVNSEDYSEYVDAPCPDCGASLLTLEDYAAFLTLVEAINMVNELDLPVSEDDELIETRITMDGSGKVNWRSIYDQT
jgi:hypothetical protein